MKAEIEVTEEHIRRGRRGTCWGCPIALAVSEALRLQVEKVMVTGPWCMIGALADRGFRLPPEARAFVDRFDHGNPVAPFRFAVDAPEADAIEITPA